MLIVILLSDCVVTTDTYIKNNAAKSMLIVIIYFDNTATYNTLILLPSEWLICGEHYKLVSISDILPCHDLRGSFV